MRIVSNKNLNHASRRRRLHGRGDCGPCGGVTGTGAPCVPRTDLGTLPSNNDDPVLVTRFSAAFTYLLVATRLAGWACKTFELRRVENAARAQCQDLGRMLALAGIAAIFCRSLSACRRPLHCRLESLLRQPETQIDYRPDGLRRRPQLLLFPRAGLGNPYEVTLARIMHYAALFCTSGELTRADVPSGEIGVRQLVMQRVWG